MKDEDARFICAMCKRKMPYIDMTFVKGLTKWVCIDCEDTHELNASNGDVTSYSNMEMYHFSCTSCKRKDPPILHFCKDDMTLCKKCFDNLEKV